MATDVEINTAINTAGSSESLRGLNKELKNLIALQGQVAAGSKQYKALQDAINKTEGKVGDLTDSFRTLRGSGVERLNSSIGLFREGLLNADTGKLTVGLEGIGSAMKAIPIFLLIEGARLLFENWDKVTEVFSESAQQIRANERALIDLNIAVNANKVDTDALIITKENELKILEKQGGSLKDIIGKLNEINNLKLEQLQNEFRKTSAEVDIAAEKLRAARQDLENKSITESIFGFGTSEDDVKKAESELAAAQVKLGEIRNKATATELSNNQAKEDKISAAQKKADEERRKRVEDFQAFLKGKNDQEIAIEQDRINTENKIHEEELAAVVKQVEEEKLFRQALAEQEIEINNQVAERTEAARRKRLDNERARAQAELSTGDKIAAIELARNIELANEQLTQDQRVAIIKKAESDIFAVKIASFQRDIQLAQQGAEILSVFNELQGQEENKRLRQLEARKNDALKNSKGNQLKIEEQFNREQLKIKKHQFEREKALRLVNIAIDTASALVKTTAELGGVGAITPAGLLLLGGITALGIAQAAVVARSQFDDTSAPPAADISVPSGGGFSAPSADTPSARIPQTFDPNAIANKTPGGKSRVVVLESDIRETMEKVDVLESRATFGI